MTDYDFPTEMYRIVDKLKESGFIKSKLGIFLFLTNLID